MKLRLLYIIIFTLEVNIIFADDYPVHDNQTISQGNLTFSIDNKGVIGYDYDNNRGSFEYPIESGHHYLSGSGFYFLYQVKMDGELRRQMNYNFDLFSANNQYVPGRYEDGDDLDLDLAEKYQLYLKDNFKESGVPVEKSDYYWPLWNSGDEFDSKLGEYVQDEERRRSEFYPLGPSFPEGLISFSTFKGTDRDHNINPIGLQIEQRVFYRSIKKGEYLIVVYDFINTSNDTLFNCYFAPAFDVEIGDLGFPRERGENDRCNINSIDSDFLGEYIASWSEDGDTETGKYGYIGFGILSSPSKDDYGIIEDLEDYKDVRSQNGKGSFLQLNANDPIYDAEYIYQQLNSDIEVDENSLDQNILISSNQFTLPPMNKGRVVTIIAVTESVSDEFPTGSKEEMADLEGLLDNGAQFWFTDILTTIEDKTIDNLSSVLYPNPANDILQIRSQDRFEEISIVDLLGREMKRIDLNSLQETSINISNLNKGTYFAIIIYSNRTEVKRFIKY